MSHSSARRSRSLSRSGRVLLASIILFATTFGMLAVPNRANARSQMRSLVPVVSQDIVISQVYGGGGNASATYTHDFIELFNRGTAPVNIKAN